MSAFTSLGCTRGTDRPCSVIDSMPTCMECAPRIAAELKEFSMADTEPVVPENNNGFTVHLDPVAGLPGMILTIESSDLKKHPLSSDANEQPQVSMLEMQLKFMHVVIRTLQNNPQFIAACDAAGLKFTSLLTQEATPLTDGE